MTTFGGKRKASSQDALWSSATTARPSKKPRRVPLDDETFANSSSDIPDESENLTDSQLCVRSSKPQTIVKKSSNSLNNTRNKFISSVIPGFPPDADSSILSSSDGGISRSGGSSRSRRKTARSQNIIDDDENVLFDSDSDVNVPSLNAGFNQDRERRRGRGADQLLWARAPRREPYTSSAAHDKVCKATRVYLLSMIFGSATGSQNTAWPEKDKLRLNVTIKLAWKTMAARMGTTPGKKDRNFAIESTPEEARKLYDTISGFRGHAMRVARRVVRSFYPWLKCKTQENVSQLSNDLLRNDGFTCLERSAEPPKGRFCAHIISTTLQQIFWSWKKAVALQSYTKDLFDPLPDVAMVFVCTCVKHAIQEYQSGRFALVIVTTSSRENAEETRFRKIFSEQSDARKKVLRKLILQRIHKAIDMDKLSARWEAEADTDTGPVAYPYSQSVDDLPLHELEGGEEHLGVLLNEDNDKESRYSNSRNLNDKLKGRRSVVNKNMREHDEDETASLSRKGNIGRVRMNDRSGGLSVKAPFDMEIRMQGKKASERSTTCKKWTRDDL